MPFCACGEILREHMPACTSCRKPNPGYTAGVSAAKGDKTMTFLSSAYADNNSMMGVLAAVAGEKDQGTVTYTTTTDDRRCVGCGRAIGTENSVTDESGGVYHATCHDSDSVCCHCGKTIAASVPGLKIKDSNGNTFHSTCFVCSHCGIELAVDGSGSDAYATTAEGQRFCRRCVEDGHSVVRVVTRRVVKTVVHDSRPGRAAFDNSPDCSICGSAIGAETPAVLPDGSIAHRSCFTCGKCGGLIAEDDEFGLKEGVAMHSRCLTDVCNGCSKPLTTKFVRIGDHKYHKDCCICSSCGGGLGGGYVIGSSGLLCGRCGGAGTTTTTVTSGTVGRGVRVNPATGKRYVAK